LLDLDGFKAVNDGLGRAVGDALLREVGLRLRGAFRSCDTVRPGGDEFAAVVTDPRGAADVEAACARVTAAIAQPFRWRGRSVVVGASIGVALCPEDARLARGPLGCADARVYAAKRARGAVSRRRLDPPLGREA
jgi:diguanylate cyclase (GGDEF)-like protein